MSELASSLKEYDNPADRIRQHRQVSKDPIIIVEGPDDVSVLAVILTGVDFFPVGGKNKVLATTAQLVEWSMKDFIAITDRDFDDESQYEPHALHHFPYSGIDLEEMLVKLGVLANLLNHIGSARKISAFGGIAAVQAAILQAAVAVAEIRRQNTLNGWGVNFDSVNLADKVDRSSLKLNTSAYCMALMDGHRGTSDVTLGRLIEVAQGASGEDFKGKDALAVASSALRKVVGTLDRAACDAKLLGDMLRAAATYELSRSAWFLELHTLVDSCRSS